MTVQTKNIILLQGDGVGPEVVREAVKSLGILNKFSKNTNILLEFKSHLIGGCAIDSANNDPLPDSTLEACKAADAILLGTFTNLFSHSHSLHQHSHNSHSLRQHSLSNALSLK